MKPWKLRTYCLCACLSMAFGSQAQPGDQMLDGIGETGLIARYTFQRDANDWSRNNWHASIRGVAHAFVQDSVFGRVLSLTGDAGTFVALPGKSMVGEASFSLSAWFQWLSYEPGQCLFEAGKARDALVLLSTTGTTEQPALRVQVTANSTHYELTVDGILPKAWNHVALVFDVSARTARVYLNGKKAGERRDLTLELADLFDQTSPRHNLLTIGSSLQGSGKQGLHALVHDVRLYRIPLTERQVATIHAIARKQAPPVTRKRRSDTDRDLPLFDSTVPRLYMAYLTDVPDVKVETTVGHLPRLPRRVHGVYAPGRQGPQVRVLWPAPSDNAQVRQPGTYEVMGKVPGTPFTPKAVVTVREAPAPQGPDRCAEPFGLDRVSLEDDTHRHPTHFMENRDKFLHGLVRTNPDQFLYMFRNAFGQPQPEGAKPLGGWDSQLTKLRGHATGHYLTAIAQAYASTGYDSALQADFAQKMTYMVDVLHDLAGLSGKPRTPGGPCVPDPCQVPPAVGSSHYESDLSEDGIRTDYWNWGVGYLSAYPPDQFILLEQGATYGTSNGQVWAPYYTLHKILAGLLDVFEISGNEKALSTARGMGDWVHARLAHLPADTLISMWNRYIAGEFGGMNEVMARLYRLTGNDRYLEAARQFDNIRLFYGDARHNHGLARNVDLVRGLHANQHIPQVVGALELYRDTHHPDYFRIADNFWYLVTNDYMYSIGGVAGARNPNNVECFTAQPATLYENGFGAGGQCETCATYNLLKLTGGLFQYKQQAALMDYYERALYNHILASVDAHTPANTYHVPLRPGSVKHFGNPDMDGFTCCNGTSLESNTKLQGSIYYQSVDNKVLFVNLFIPSTLRWIERNVTVTQQTAYPRSDRTRLLIDGKGAFELNIRVPHWASKGCFVTINGKVVEVEARPGAYLTLKRSWKRGDLIEVRMPFTFYLEPVMDQPNIASLFYGPVLLAAQESEPRTDWRKVTLSASDLGATIQGDPETLEFTIDGVSFRPFFDTYGRHSVYLDVTLSD